MSEDLPIACDLSSAERQRREVAIRREVAALAEVIVEREEGIEARFPGDRDCLLRLAELVALERDCCRFLRFDLVAEPGAGPIRLRISGPDGTGDFLRSWFFSSGESVGDVASDSTPDPGAHPDRASASGEEGESDMRLEDEIGHGT